MPRISPAEFECDTCGWKGVVTSTPVRCVCRSLCNLDGTVIEGTQIWTRPGDIVAKVADPIARATGLKTSAGGCSGCNKARKALNTPIFPGPEPQ